jgi:two-component system response regulator YesN
MAYKVMIVDDEPRARKGISAMVGEDPSWEIVAMCKDGLEALECMENHRNLHLIITDIRMPNLEGIPFISAVRERNPSVEIIIISGFGEFEYARQALQLRVSHFILKPVIEEEFYSILASVKETIRIKNFQADSMDLLKYRDLIFAEAVDMGKTDKFLQLMSHSDSDSFDMVQFHLVVYQFDFNMIKQNHMPSFFQQLFRPYDIHPYIDSERLYCYKNCFVCLLIPKNQIRIDQLREFLFYSIQAISLEHNLLCTAGISELIQLNHIKTAFTDALILLKQEIYEEAEPSYVFDSDYTDNTLLSPYKWLQKMDNCISIQDFSIANDVLIAVLDEFSKHKPDYRTLQEWVNQIVGILKNQAAHYHISSKLFADIHNKLTTLIFYRKFSDIRRDLFTYLKEIVNVVERTSESKQKSRIEEIKFYLDHNYDRDISLNEIAEQFSFNPSYLSSFFKAETDINITDYLINLRIEHSKTFLTDTEMKINEISLKLGYNNTQYFHKIFKKMNGVTPTDYRKLYRSKTRLH